MIFFLMKPQKILCTYNLWTLANLKKNIYVKASPRTKTLKEECSAKHNTTANMVKKLLTVLDVLYSNTNSIFTFLCTVKLWFMSPWCMRKAWEILWFLNITKNIFCLYCILLYIVSSHIKKNNWSEETNKRYPVFIWNPLVQFTIM